MREFIIQFAQQNPMLILGALALLVSTLGVSTALIVKRINAENRFYDKLESDSLSQINQNVKDIERILSAPFVLEGSPEKITLNEVLESRGKVINSSSIQELLGKLSVYFAEYSANLEKYSTNIIPRKKFCFVYQEHGMRARRLLELFERYSYEDISLGFAKLHLKQANISYE